MPPIDGHDGELEAKQPRRPSQYRWAQVLPLGQPDVLVHARQVTPGQSVGRQAQPDEHVPDEGPVQPELMLTHLPVAPHHPQLERGVQVPHVYAIVLHGSGGDTHVPLAHDWPEAQAWPQAPQLAALVAVLTQTPPQTVPEHDSHQFDTVLHE
jgi:hypothetical protein